MYLFKYNLKSTGAFCAEEEGGEILNSILSTKKVECFFCKK